MIKKVLLSCLVLILALNTRYSTSFADGVTTQSVYEYNCSDTWTVCLAIQSSFGTSSAISSGMYIPAGVNVDINGYTFDDSLFNMRFYLIDSSGKAVAGTTVNAGPFGGGDYISWRNPTGGTYRMQVICFGNNPTYKCTGEGTFQYTRQ